jgi:ribosomal protein S18 acetylase RimI-like enzyme
MNPLPASAPESERCSSVKIRLLASADWQDLRSARLAALKDSPDAFTATLADEMARKPADWRARIERSVWAGAWENGHVVGIACLSAAEPEEPTRWFIESVWVTPRHRRQGLVRRMLHKLERPARVAGATHLQLWVLDTNYAAVDAYLKLDFQLEPERVHNSTKPCEDGFVQEHLMVKPLW